MKLYMENEQSLTCSKTNSPKFNSRDDWYYLEANVDDKVIKFYYSHKCKDFSEDPFNGFLGRSREYYLYFQLDSQWYTMNVFQDQEFNYLGYEDTNILYYLERKGTFTTKKANRKLDGVDFFDIAQIELLSETLARVMKNINEYNADIEVRLQEGKLLLVNKVQGEYVIKRQ